MRAILASVLLLAGCELFESDGTGSLGTRMSPLLFFSIGDPVEDGPAVGTFQDALDDWSYVFDNANPDEPEYDCQHDDEEMLIKAEENDIPMQEVCIASTTPRVDDPEAPPFTPTPPPPNPQPETFTGQPGTNPMPTGYEAWTGAEHGGCGVWSIAMCNRRIGAYDATLPVVEGEWDTIAEEIHLDPEDGSSNAQDRAAYYRARGYCIVDKQFDGTQEDYTEVRDNLDECDVKLRFYRRTATGYAFGHVETVTAAGSRSLTTNSWGAPAAIEGGTAGGFGHWQDGKRWMEDDGDPTYPPDSTDVMVTYVCPCTHPMMEDLGDRILRAIGVR